MPDTPEYIGKAHEKLTRDILNGVDPQPDTVEQLDHLPSGQQDRVQLGSEKTAEFIRDDLSFPIESATEVGDELRGVSGDDTDLVVVGAAEEKRYSLKMVGSGKVNVRNPTLNTICENLLDQSREDLLEELDRDDYHEIAERYAEDEIESKELAAVVLPVLAETLRGARDQDEVVFRERLADELQLDSNTIACKVTDAGYYHGIVSTTQGTLSKVNDPNTTLEIYTTDNSSTSVFFDIDGDRAFQISVYGQNSGGQARAALRAAYWVPV
ncbi:hypothetical protein [Halorubrum ezzemoulense]|uniref:hypothetical protein n=1 Tax=Halorubrum ezzemoulense TaxID=337243 RepID=UPI00117AAB8F|nr:hypothetical protein [Halorubrum ezzemoulense]